VIERERETKRERESDRRVIESIFACFCYRARDIILNCVFPSATWYRKNKLCLLFGGGEGVQTLNVESKIQAATVTCSKVTVTGTSCFDQASLPLAVKFPAFYSDIHAFRYSDIQIFRYSDNQIFRYSDIRIFRYSDIQIFRYSRNVLRNTDGQNMCFTICEEHLFGVPWEAI